MDEIKFKYQRDILVSFNDRGKILKGIINKRVCMDYEGNDTRNWIYYGIKVPNPDLKNDFIYFDKIVESQIIDEKPIPTEGVGFE
jgi:hypothetical protein